MSIYEKGESCQAQYALFWHSQLNQQKVSKYQPLRLIVIDKAHEKNVVKGWKYFDLFGIFEQIEQMEIAKVEKSTTVTKLSSSSYFLSFHTCSEHMRSSVNDCGKKPCAPKQILESIDKASSIPEKNRLFIDTRGICFPWRPIQCVIFHMNVISI